MSGGHLNAQPPALSDDEFEWRSQRRDLGALLRVVGAFLPVAPGFVQAYAENSARLTDQRLLALTEELRQTGMDVRELEAALSDGARGEVIERAVEAAVNSRQQDKLRLLAGVIASASRVAVDEAHLMLWLIERMEAVHVAILHLLARPRAQRVSGMPATVSGAWSPTELSNALPDLARYVPMCLAWLASHGLIRDVTVGTWNGVQGNPQWSLTELGGELMAFVQQSDDGLDHD